MHTLSSTILCSTINVTTSQCHGKDGETAVTVPVTSSAALASRKTAKRERCWHQPAFSFTLGPASAHPALEKVSEGCIDISALEWLRKNTILFFSKEVFEE